MIESYAYEALQTIAADQAYRPEKVAVCLGDQKPTRYCKHETARALFKSLGYPHFYDVDYNGNADVQADLNYPVTLQAGVADVLFDGGVLEHVCNIGQALQTILRLVRPDGGWVVMVNPVNCYGESYYALDPQLHRDFFEANGFSTFTHKVFSRGGLRGSLIRAAQEILPERVKAALIERFRKGTVVKSFCLKDDPSELRWHSVEGDFHRYPLTAHTFYVARRGKEVPLQWPHQRKYPAAS